MSRLMRQPQGCWPHFAALGYAVGGYLGGLGLLLAEPAGLNLLGVLWQAHALVIAAYLIHECAHNTVFAAARHNAWLGEALSFLVGAACGDYADIRRKHLRHHTDRAYVDRNTFSNPLSLRHPWLNLPVLNFGYHNAHHVHPKTPWYALPRLHRQLYGESCSQVLPVADLFKAYACHRAARVLNADPADTPGVPAADFIGVVGVSFLTAH